MAILSHPMGFHYNLVPPPMPGPPPPTPTPPLLEDPPGITHDFPHWTQCRAVLDVHWDFILNIFAYLLCVLIISQR